MASRLPSQTPKQYSATLNDFKDGVISLLDEARLPLSAAKEAKNLMQYQDGLWGTRWGTKDYGAAFTGPIAGAAEFVLNNPDGSTTTRLLIIDNGVPKYSEDGGLWTTIGTKTFDVNAPMAMLQLRDKMLLANGINNFSYYDLAANNIFEFGGITDPGVVTLTRGAGLATGTHNAYYQVTAVNEVGESGPSTEASIAINKRRNEWNTEPTSTENIKLTWTAVTGATRYNIYYSDASGYGVYLDSIEATATPAYTDTGRTAPNDFIEVPDANTTVGPKFNQMGLSGNRIWATGDPAHPHRVYWFGSGRFALSTSPFYGGGYVDLELGGKERPKWVGHFRDGKGTPLSTALTSDPDGNGSTNHIDIITQTVGETQINIPAVMKASASVGTTSPRGVVESRSSLHYPSRKGFYTTGSKPQLMNVLSTDEMSVNIRPDINSIKVDAMGGIAGGEFDGKLWWTVPYASDKNNRIIILDQEKRNWNPYAFDFGVKQFLLYTDNQGTTHWLGVPNDGEGNKLLKFSSDYKNDNGAPIETSYISPVIHFDESHVSFVHVDYVYIELARPVGSIEIRLTGKKKNGTLDLLYTNTVQGSGANVGWSSQMYTTVGYTYVDDQPKVFSESSLKRRVKVNKLLNSIQLKVSSGVGDTSYTINQFHMTGRYVPTSDPTSWRL